MTVRLCTICAAMTIACAAPSIAQERFDSPEAAAQAVIDAAEHQDSARLSAIFGSRATGILTSGNSKQDRAEQAEFARLARAKTRQRRAQRASLQNRAGATAFLERKSCPQGIGTGQPVSYHQLRHGYHTNRNGV